MCSSISSTAAARAGSTSTKPGSSESYSLMLPRSCCIVPARREVGVGVVDPLLDRVDRALGRRRLDQPHVAVGGTDGLVAVVGRHQEELGARVARPDDLLLDAADGADVAAGVDG